VTESSFNEFRKTFPDYKGGQDTEKCCNHVRDKFIVEDGEAPEVYTHVTCALDTDAITAVFEAVKEDIFMKRIASNRPDL